MCSFLDFGRWIWIAVLVRPLILRKKPNTTIVKGGMHFEITSKTRQSNRAEFQLAKWSSSARKMAQ